jgi:hypothetical protein
MLHFELTADVIDRMLVAVGLIVSVWSVGVVYFLIKSVERRESKTMDYVLKSAASAIRSRPIKSKA